MEQEAFSTVALAGMITGTLTQTLGEIAKELRRYAGGDFDKCLDALERRAIRSIKNAAIDGIPEDEQLALVEKTRAFVSAVFADARAAS